MADFDKVYELKKEIDVSNIMQLIDINGTKQNFQSDFMITLKDPSRKILVAIVNQEQLDNGELNFELCEDGKFGRRVTFQENMLQNHFIAVKKIPNDKDDTVSCSIVIRLTELPPPPPKPQPVEPPKAPPPSPENYNLNPEMPPDVKENIQQQLFNLSNNPEYLNQPYISQDGLQLEDTSEKSYNSYYIVGIICLALFFFILLGKLRASKS